MNANDFAEYLQDILAKQPGLKVTVEPDESGADLTVRDADGDEHTIIVPDDESDPDDDEEEDEDEDDEI